MCKRAKPLRDRLGIAADVERMPYPRQHCRDDTRERRSDRQHERVMPRSLGNGDPARQRLVAALDRERSRVPVDFDRFETGDRTCAEEIEQRRPVVRRPKRELEAHRGRQRCRRRMLR